MKKEDKDESGIDLRRFKRHQRKIPWSLIRKIAMAIIIIGLLWYAKTVFDKRSENAVKEQKEDEFEIEVE